MAQAAVGLQMEVAEEVRLKLELPYSLMQHRWVSAWQLEARKSSVPVRMSL